MLSAFILEMVEARLNEARRSPRDDSKPREENKKLKEDVKLISLALERAGTGLFWVKHSNFLQRPDGDLYSNELIELLHSGGIWSKRQLMESLGINPNDADAIKNSIASAQDTANPRRDL